MPIEPFLRRRSAGSTGQSSFSTWDVPSSGLKLWLDASRLVGYADGDGVSTWLDISGSGNHATQATASLRPLYKTSILNGKPVIRFDGTDDLLRADGLASLFSGSDLPGTFIVVCKQAATTSGKSNMSFGKASTATPFFIPLQTASTTTLRINRTDDLAAGKTAESGVVTLTNANIFVSTFSGTLGNIYVNGAQSGTANQDVDVGVVTLDEFAVGALIRVTAAQFYNGDIAEVLVYNRVVQSSELDTIESYLGTKYNIIVS